ncbi:MAG: hypothetical protein ABL983_00990 [Nitrospira sp.]
MQDLTQIGVSITSRVFAVAAIAVIATFGATPMAAVETNSARLVLTALRSPISNAIVSDQGEVPPPASTRTLELQATPGEFEPASFVITTMQDDIPSIRIRSSDLVGDVGQIGSSAVDIRLVKVWYQAGTAWVDIRRSTDARKLVPELLVRDDDLIKVDKQNKTNLIRLSTTTGPQYVDVQLQSDDKKRILLDASRFPIRDAATLQPFTLPLGSNKQVWVTIHVPKNAEAGTYLGTITISSGEIEIGTVPLRLEVLPFHLSDPALEYSIYYRGLLVDTAPSMSSEHKTEKQMCAEFKDLQEHGISNPTVYQYSGDSKALERVLELRRKCGISSSSLYYLGFFIDPKDFESRPTAIQKRLLDTIATAHANGFTQTYFYGVDEAIGAELVRQRDAWTFVHKQGGKVYVAGKTGTFDVVGRYLDMLVAAGVPVRSEAGRYHAVGGRVFSYANPQVGVENPLVFRRNYGLILWQQDYDGAMPYAYQHSEGSPWNDFDGRYRDHMFAYPTIDGVIDTLAWEGFREGVDDIRYLTTLMNRLEALRPCAAAKASFKAAEQHLISLKRRVLGNLDDERLTIINLMLSLQNLHCDIRSNQ